jgi:hypothetical protein
MATAEVVMGEVQSDGCAVIFQLFAKPVRQTGEPAHGRHQDQAHTNSALPVPAKPLIRHQFLDERAGSYGTLKGTLLESVRLGVTTWIFPLVAPAGRVVVIKYLDTTVNLAAVPLKLTLVAPVRLVPRIFTADPTLPKGGRVFTNGPRPTDRLKTVPSPFAPPYHVVP